MHKLRLLPAFLTVLMMLSVPSLFAADFREAVQQGFQTFTEAVKKGDSATIGSLYADDAIAFPPNSEMVSGKDAIQSYWRGTMESGVTEIQLELVSTESESNYGIEVGKYIILGAEKKELDRGKYVVVWKKVKDGWKLYRDIWNTSMPLPEPPK